MIELTGLRVAGVYLMLKKRESELDSMMSDLADELEAYLYDRLSIEEMEGLNELYQSEDTQLGSKI